MIPRRELLARLSLLGLLGRGRRLAAAQDFPTERPASALIQAIEGPLVVTGNLARQRELFEGVLGLSLVADQELDAVAVRTLFGVPDRTARSVLLETKGTSVGVRFVEFRPGPGIAVREAARPIDADALGVIDFMVPDLDRAKSALARRRFNVAPVLVNYSTPEDGRFTEAQVQGPDGVNCSLVQMHDAPISRYVAISDHTFSEILGISAPVSDRDAAIAFYRDTLKLKSLMSYDVAGPTPARRALFGVTAHAPMVGVTDYGLPRSAFRSLRDRSVLPHRGLLAVRFSVPSVDAVALAAAAARLQVVAPPSEVLLFPQGRVKSFLIRAPHGVLHQFTETLKG